MRPMDSDNAQNNIHNVVQRDNSPIPSPPSANIRVNSILRVTTMYDAERTGKVVAYDPASNLVTLRKLIGIDSSDLERIVRLS